jgi:excisionase family DNA binding protein
MARHTSPRWKPTGIVKHLGLLVPPVNGGRSIVRVKEAAARLEASPATVYGLIAAGKLRCVRIGIGRGTIRILDEFIAEYLQQAEPVPKQAPAPAPTVRLKHITL